MNLLTLKADVQLKALDPRLVLADLVVADQFQALGLDCQITSGTDGIHMAGSKHYLGLAHDYKTFHVPPDALPALVIAIAVALPGYDVLYEAPTKPTALPQSLYWQSPQPHVHVEFDPHTYVVS